MQWVAYREIAIAYYRWSQELSVPGSWRMFINGTDDSFEEHPDNSNGRPDYCNNRYGVSDQGAQKIRILNSPHYRALFKALEIQEQADGSLR